MSIVQIQQVRQAKRGEMERTCKQERGASFTCSVVDFNSGAFSQLIVYEDFNDVRLVYAPEKQLGYFGGDEIFSRVTAPEAFLVAIPLASASNVGSASSSSGSMTLSLPIRGSSRHSSPSLPRRSSAACAPASPDRPRPSSASSSPSPP